MAARRPVSATHALPEAEQRIDDCAALTRVRHKQAIAATQDQPLRSEGLISTSGCSYQKSPLTSARRSAGSFDTPSIALARPLNRPWPGSALSTLDPRSVVTRTRNPLAVI